MGGIQRPQPMPSDVDVAIIGGGPAGLAAAIELRRLGVARVAVLERESEAGGIPRHAAHTGFGLRDLRRLLSGPQYAARYVALAREAGVAVRAGVTVTGWSGATALSLTSRAGVEELGARAVILATGCRERPRAARLVPGTRPLGIYTTGALQQLVYLHHLPVGRRAVVVGAEHVSFSAVLTLHHAGSATAAMVTEHAQHQTYAPFKWITATRLRVPILTETRVTRILGARRVEAVELTARRGAARQVECDAIVFTGDWIPDHELARRGGLVMDPATRAPRVDGALRTSVRGVFAAGNLLHGAETADIAALGGRHAARAVCDFLRSDTWPAQAPIPIVCAPPLHWISPSAVEPSAPPPHGHFILRVAQICIAVDLRVTQDDRSLWRQRYRRLVPNRPLHAAASWLDRVDPNGGAIHMDLLPAGHDGRVHK